MILLRFQQPRSHLYIREDVVDLPQTLRKLRSEKKWFDEVIDSLEQFQRSKPFRAATLLDLHLAQKGRFNRSAIHTRSSRRLSRWLREYNGRPTG